MRFQILGSIRVEIDGHEVPITAGRDRVLLGALLLYANQPMTRDQLIDAVWPGKPPRDARNQLQGCVSRLRKRLGGQFILTEPTGYRMVVNPGDLDLLAFRRLVAQARIATSEEQYEQAAAGYRSALALWRGPALAGIDGHTIPRAATTLDEERIQALEECLDAELATGAGGELVAELDELVKQHPLREGLHRALMLALYRAGRQADALAAYRRAQRLLLEELGAEPGAELQRMHGAILNHDPTLAAPPSAGRRVVSPRPRQLPTDVTGFSGRADALKALDELFSRRSETAGAVVISAIAGTAGVGKTALAVHWAHMMADRFPDGQLYVNLRGFDPAGTPVEPATAIRGLLDALAVPRERIPSNLDAQAALYRSLLADRRLLVVLDNARDPEQVRPLLPGASGCLVLVTSRNQLSGLIATDGAIPLRIDVLPDGEARQLLATRLGYERVEAEPEAVAELVTACAGLPLALAILAAHAATQPDFPLSAIAERVHQREAGLEPWTGTDPASNLRTVFSWSYRDLDPAAARMFRLLGLHPSPDFAAPAAASLMAVPLSQACRTLAELTEANLIIEQTPGRWTLHDLLRTYATELAESTDTESDRRTALHRLLDHYFHTAHAGRTLLDPHHRSPYSLGSTTPTQPGAATISLHTSNEAMAWFAAEKPALLAAIGMASTQDFHTHAWQLSSCLGVFIGRTGDPYDMFIVKNAALLAAQRLSDRSIEAQAHNGIGLAHAGFGRWDLALDHLQRALELYSLVGDGYGQAMGEMNVAMAEMQRGNPLDALPHGQRAHELFHEEDDRAGEGRSLNLIAWCYSLLGDHQQAIAHCERALAIHREVGDTIEEGATWDSLGYANHQLGDYERAITCFHQALALFDGREQRFTQAEVHHHLGDACYANGQPDAARSAWSAAIDRYPPAHQSKVEEVRAKLHRL